jgi:hypothetical protein
VVSFIPEVYKRARALLQAHSQSALDRLETAPPDGRWFSRQCCLAQGGTMPGDRSWQSVSWPLKVIFGITFLVGIIGLLWFRIGSWTETISWILLGISIVAALMLLFFADFMRKGAISVQLEATSTDLKAVAKQLEPTGVIGAKLEAIERKFDDHLNDVRKQLERLANLLDERTARLKTIKGQLGPDGDLEKGLKTISDAQGDPTKMKAAVDSLQQTVDKLRENMSTIT